MTLVHEGAHDQSDILEVCADAALKEGQWILTATTLLAHSTTRHYDGGLHAIGEDITTVGFLNLHICKGCIAPGCAGIIKGEETFLILLDFNNCGFAGRM